MPTYSFRSNPKGNFVKIDSKGALRKAAPPEKLPKGKVDMFVTPGFDPEPESPPAPVDRDKRMLNESQRKARKLQRA